MRPFCTLFTLFHLFGAQASLELPPRASPAPGPGDRGQERQAPAGSQEEQGNLRLAERGHGLGVPVLGPLRHGVFGEQRSPKGCVPRAGAAPLHRGLSEFCWSPANLQEL